MNTNKDTVAVEGMQVTNVCNVEDISEGQMKDFVVGDDNATDVVLVCRVDGKLYCVASKCAHFGVPLKNGMLIGDRIYCPAHWASFSVVTGCPDGGPVLDGLKTFDVWEKDGKICVRAPAKI